MALSLTTAIKDQVAQRIFSSRTYSALGTGYQQDLIDNEGAAALVELENYATWFTLATGTGNAPDAWKAWFVDRIVARLEPNTHPEKAEQSARMEARSKADALASYARLAPDYSPGSTTEAYVYQMYNTRKAVLAHCARLRPALFPDPMTIDAAFDEVYKYFWNRAGYAMRRRTVTVTITPTNFTAATWNATAKTLTVGSATFTATTGGGSYVVVTAGTNAVPREYPVTSATTTVLTLPDNIGATDGSADIQGYHVTVAYSGMAASEEFKSMVSVRWYYADDDALAWPLSWLDADAFAVRRNIDANNLDRPRFFRTFNVGSAVAWRFTPQPDQAYTCRGEVLVAQPAAPTTATATTLFDKFHPEFQSVMRRATLARVLTNHDRHNAQMSMEVKESIDDLFPTAQDIGDADSRMTVTDVYNDVGAMFGGPYGMRSGGMLGGPL